MEHTAAGSRVLTILIYHIYYPTYLGARDQEDCSSKPHWAINSKDPMLKITNTKKELAGWLKW
jgi:hypothetical protein